MSRYEIYSPEGLRIDGRRWNELRHFNCRVNTHPSADGSSYVEQGLSKVVCIVKGPHEPDSRANTNPEALSVAVSLSVSPFSTTDRKKRLRNDRRVQEMAAMLQRTFSEAVLGHLHPRTQLTISLHVLAQDGGLLPACINAATLAVMDAGVPLYDYVSACSAALFEATPLLDPSNLEENDLPFLTVGIIGQSEKVSLLLLENRMALDRLESVLAIAIAGCRDIRTKMDRAVRAYGRQRLQKA
ncbi:exosome complex component Ski6p [Trichomonascus vanleenenianus]|uniref:exosome non-catalytic core subunit SKI6 n=1 Tax=Trichomonascus vanleenenianus TaxID=2268995 RepID=UPI003ECB4D43